MKPSIVSDTSSLIIFNKLDRLDLLASVFNTVIVPHRVLSETLSKEDELALELTQNSLFNIRKTTDSSLLNLLDELLDHGEAEAISLAKELNYPLLIDEKKGRKIAQKMDIKIIGFLGILLLNNKQEKLSSEEAKALLKKAQDFHFRISDKLQRQFVQLLGR